jgi:NAD(P)-dependent dehydrogenase (short-subunit alcohol dehydrogenase family)
VEHRRCHLLVHTVHGPAVPVNRLGDRHLRRGRTHQVHHGPNALPDRLIQPTLAAMTRPLEGRVSIVTGAGRGIGRAVCLALADAGSSVVLAARTAAQLEQVKVEVEKKEAVALSVQTDVTDQVAVQRLVDMTMDRMGRIDILVNNAGSNNGGPDGAVGELWNVNPDAWWRDIEINLRGTFLCSRAVLPHMVAAGRGHLVNIVSMAAIMPWPYNSAYAVSKAAVIRLTDSLADEVRDWGVYTFALSPGSVDTELRAGAVDSPAGRRWLTKVNPNPDWVPAERPARTIVRLVSGEADQLSGRFLSIDWELDELTARAGEIVGRDLLQLRLSGP